MAQVITGKIVGAVVVDPDATALDPKVSESLGNIVQMHEAIERADLLPGTTYKLKTPLSEHALYITINDILLNEGTPHEVRRPYEIFINSKNMEHFQWIVALTRILSAVFRKGGDINFIAEELQQVFDPGGGYLKRGGKHVPSLVSEIGDVLERHLIGIGLIRAPVLEEQQQRLLEEKRKALDLDEGEFPPNSILCKKCQHVAAIMMDGCLTCLNCGDSKCG